MTDPTPVEILEIRDRVIEVHLADGAILHFRPQVLAVMRGSGPDGPDSYQVRTHNNFVVIREPDAKPVNKPIPLKPVS